MRHLFAVNSGARSRFGAVAACALHFFCAGCANDTWNGEVPATDTAMFQAEVYPVLMRDCAFNACHGAPNRFFQVFGPSRTRLDPNVEQDAPATPLELQFSYERARSMLVTTGPVTRSLLLVKPLEQAAGGVGHLGVDDFNRNVYQSKQDPGYMTLLKWAQLTAASPNAGAAPAGTRPTP